MLEFFGADQVPYNYKECANAREGTKKDDYQTFCCDGTIIDKTYNFWSGDVETYVMDIKNMVCCREGGRLLPGGIQPIDNGHTRCGAGQKPEPLASLVATNTKNAELYTLTYESASELATGGWGDWTYTATPTCLWIQTANPDVSLAEVIVPAADITTLPRPVTDVWGDPITTSDGCGWGNSDASCSDEQRTTGANSTQPAESPSVTDSTSDNQTRSVVAAAAPTSSAEFPKRKSVILVIASAVMFLGMLNPWAV